MISWALFCICSPYFAPLLLFAEILLLRLCRLVMFIPASYLASFRAAATRCALASAQEWLFCHGD